MSLRLRAALQGDLTKIMRQETKAAERAVTLAVKEATTGLKLDLRAQVTGAGFSSRFSKTWRGKTYPKKASMNAAGFVFSKAPEIMESYSSGAVIRAKKSAFLAIPLPAAGKKAMGKKVTPELWEQKHKKKLIFIKRKGSNPILIAENMRARKGKRGGFANASKRALKTGKGLTTVPIFVLVPQVTVKKRFDVDAPAKKWSDQLPRLITKNWPEDSKQ